MNAPWERLMDTYSGACKKVFPGTSWARTNRNTEAVILAVVLDTISLCGEVLDGYPDTQPELVQLKAQLKEATK